MVRSTFTAPIAILIGPFGHFYRVYGVVGQRGDNNRHGCGAAAIAADMVGAIRLVAVAFIQLIEIHHLCYTVCKGDVVKGWDSCHGFICEDALEHTVSKEQAQVPSIVIGQNFLLIAELEDGVREIRFTVVDDGVDVPQLRFLLDYIRCVRVICIDPSGLRGSGERIEMALARPENRFQIRGRNGFPVLILSGAVLPKKGICVADEVAFIGIDDLIIVPGSTCKVMGDSGRYVIDAFVKDLVDGKCQTIGRTDDGRIVVQNRLVRITGRAEIGKATEDNRRKHEEK